MEAQILLFLPGFCCQHLHRLSADLPRAVFNAQVPQLIHTGEPKGEGLKKDGCPTGRASAKMFPSLIVQVTISGSREWRECAPPNLCSASLDHSILEFLLT